MKTSRISAFWSRPAVLFLMAVSLALIVSACSDPTPTPTNTPRPTNTPTPTATPVPTNTPTPRPTATPTPTPEPARLGTEEVRTSVLEANFVPGQSRSATEVWFYGSGFRPGQEVYLFITDSNGAWTDISVPAESRRDGGGTVWPLIANEDGAWATNWRIGRFSRNGVGGEGQWSARVTDTDFNILATTPLALCNNGGARPEGEEVPSYCSA